MNNLKRQVETQIRALRLDSQAAAQARRSLAAQLRLSPSARRAIVAQANSLLSEIGRMGDDWKKISRLPFAYQLNPR